MWQGSLLRVVDVLQQRAGCGDADRVFIATEACQIARAELFAQEPRSALYFEMPGWAAASADTVAQARGNVGVFIDDDFGGPQALEFAGQRLDARDFG